MWVWWPKPAEQPRERQYLDFTACLLTDEHGLSGPDAAPVWAGMQEASLATRAKVEYVAVTGPQTVPNALPFLSSLVQGRCDLVFAAGPVPVDAVREGASTFPKARFFVVGTSVQKPNVSTVEGKSPAEVQAAVKRILTSAVPTS
ncbi:MAG: hypothetical protein AUI14_22165 [Actinobacteria bacterium 13_2_20CM_2_71_6]|nr:MAG: hypothetical protein AUI14_22165 [Actinobacteria bacterium 13_2_20CM_2_71_6]